MVGRRVFVKDRLGNCEDRFRVTIRKSDSEESMEEGELSGEDYRKVCWDDPTRITRMRGDTPAEHGDGDRRVVEKEIGKESIVRRFSLGNTTERKRRIGWGDPYDPRAKRSRQFSNFKETIQEIIQDKGKASNKHDSTRTFLEESQNQNVGWEKKLKGPRMGMIADMVDKRISAKQRLNGKGKEDVIKRKIVNPKAGNTMEINDVGTALKTRENILRTEVVEECDDDELDNITRTIEISNREIRNTKNRFAGRLGPAFDEDASEEIESKLQKMEKKIQRRRMSVNLEHDDGSDLPEWDETVVINVSPNELDLEREKRRKQVNKELELIEEAKQREEIRRLKLEDIKKSKMIEQEKRSKEEMRIKQQEEARRQEELIQKQMQIIERQKEIDKEKRNLEIIKEMKEKEVALKKRIENEARAKKELEIVKEKERRLEQEKRYKERKRIEQIREERRKEERQRDERKRKESRNKTKDSEKKKKSKKKDSSDEESSTDSDDSDSDSSSSSESESDSSDSDSDDSEYERRRRKNRSKGAGKNFTPKKKSQNERDKESKHIKEEDHGHQRNLNNKDAKGVIPQKHKEDKRGERNNGPDKAENKQPSEEVKKTTELKDKLKNYLSRAKEAKENKKK